MPVPRAHHGPVGLVEYAGKRAGLPLVNQRPTGWARVRRALGRPRQTIATVRANKVGTVAVVVRSVPRPIGRVMGVPMIVVGDFVTRRRPAQSAGPAIAFIGRSAAWSPDRAIAAAIPIGTSPAIPPESRTRLGRMVWQAGGYDAAAAIVASMPDADAPGLSLLRANLAQRAGRYREALELAETARREGDPQATAKADQIRGQLAVLDPDWTPDLGPGRARLRSLRGRATPGRVLHLLSNSLPERQVGYTIRAQAIARCQIASGLDPHLVTRAGFPGPGSGRRPDTGRIDGVPYHRLAPTFAAGGRHDRTVEATVRAAVPLLEQLRPAVLHPASNHLQAQAALALAEPLGIPVVYEVRGFLEETWAAVGGEPEDRALQSDRYVLNRAAETRAMLAADAVVTLSETMRGEIIERGCRPEDVVVVPNAVDVEWFVPRPRDAELADRWGIAATDPVIGYISTFSAYEGIRYLIEATALLRDRGRHAKLLLVGDGDQRDDLAARVHALGLDDGTVVMPGRVPHGDVVRFHSLIDVFVVPRTGDRVARLVTPLKPYEAMAMERAVVVSDVPALREIVVPGETGLVFRPEDAEDLADVLEGVIDDEPRRRELGLAARAWVVESRTWAQNGRRYRELYERLGVV